MTIETTKPPVDFVRRAAPTPAAVAIVRSRAKASSHWLWLLAVAVALALPWIYRLQQPRQHQLQTDVAICDGQFARCRLTENPNAEIHHVSLPNLLLDAQHRQAAGQRCQTGPQAPQRFLFAEGVWNGDDHWSLHYPPASSNEFGRRVA